MQDELLRNELIQLLWTPVCVCVCVGGGAFQGVHGSLETDQGKKRYDGMTIIMSDEQLTCISMLC